jgi:ADP-ribosylglycohydrolase
VRRTRPVGGKTKSAFRGCLLGGAVGDALGAPIEFMSLREITQRFGAAGILNYAPAYGRLGAITDDTQMTLFTAEGLIRAQHRIEGRGIASIAGATRYAYLRWLRTQGERVETPGEDGWLVGLPELHSRRAPGNTCLAALRAHARREAAEPVNDSKGCGTVMRIAPVGLAPLESAFEIGCELAAITHGHPTGVLAAGYLAQVVAEVAGGATLRDAAHGSLRLLAKMRRSEETVAAVESALEAAAHGTPSPAAVEALGGGWVAEEALAIGLYCGLVARDFEHGVLLAVNHGGDSDSTGAIAGNLLGLMVGEEGIPARWLEQLELREVIIAVADDVWSHFAPGARCGGDDLDRYPPN